MNISNQTGDDKGSVIIFMADSAEFIFQNLFMHFY